MLYIAVLLCELIAFNQALLLTNAKGRSKDLIATKSVDYCMSLLTHSRVKGVAHNTRTQQVVIDSFKKFNKRKIQLLVS